VVIAIVGFVLYRLRQFRREAAQAQPEEQAHAAQQPTAPKRPGRHRSDAEV